MVVVAKLSRGVTGRASRRRVGAMAARGCAKSGVVPAVIIGGGRIGCALKDMGRNEDVIVRRGEPFPSEPAEGPIFVCTRNDVLDGVVDSCPPHRREDLVFLQNGMLEPWLKKRGLEENTQALIYMAVAKLGDPPTDGITDMAPDGLTASTGKWAQALADRLESGSMSCHVLDKEAFSASMCEKLIWISAFMLVGARHPGATVGEVESTYRDEVTALIEELAKGVSDITGVTFSPQVPERLCAYARSVAHFPTAVKEFDWRNGYFYTLSKAALSDGSPDPFPTHTSYLEEVGTVKPLPKFALLFDCDGVIVETEELHRLAYNKSFDHFQLKIDGTPVDWSVAYYDVLQNTVGGGKPKMKYHFGEKGWPQGSHGEAPVSEEDRNALVDALQDKKTEAYKQLIEEVATACPGVLELMDAGLERADIAMAICSASTRAGFEKVVNQIVGEERLSKFDVVLAGDDVHKKKPDPLIYNLARQKLGVPRERCVVIEDSIVGLNAAKAADMPCVITPTSANSTSPEVFMKEGAAAVVDSLADEGVSIDAWFPSDSDVPLVGPTKANVMQ